MYFLLILTICGEVPSILCLTTQTIYLFQTLYTVGFGRFITLVSTGRVDLL